MVDYPNSTKAKKMFLVLMCGQANVALPQGLDGEEGERDHIAMAGRERTAKQKKKKGGGKRFKLCQSNMFIVGREDVKKKDWIAAKKERRRLQGKKTANDSKYSGRSRGPKF